MLEFYCAYMDADGMMDFSEAMLRTVIQNATGEITMQDSTSTILISAALSD